MHLSPNSHWHTWEELPRLPCGHHPSPFGPSALCSLLNANPRSQAHVLLQYSFWEVLSSSPFGHKEGIWAEGHLELFMEPCLDFSAFLLELGRCFVWLAPHPTATPSQLPLTRRKWKRVPLSSYLRTLKRQAVERKTPPTWGSPRFRKQLNTRWQFLWRSATWEVGKRSPDVLRTDLDINNL